MTNFIRRRLQVFVSSTYHDLIEERQAAVEAILAAGHIPAGMELFPSCDASQLQVIKEWIDESDVYLLIFGGRYGSIEPETGKSYSQLEFEYALQTNKPLFSCVIKDDALEHRTMERGRAVLELGNPSALQHFREIVTGKTVRFWSDAKDIKIIVGETLGHFSRREDLVGWVRPTERANISALADEIARLSKENSDLRQEFFTKAIPNRADLYRSCIDLVKSSQQIRDTSWGQYTRPLDEFALAARQEYRRAVSEAIRKGRSYRELFSKSEQRSELISDAKQKLQQKGGYEAKILDIDLSRISILDFMIGDDSKVILSHVDARHEVPTFLYVHSRDVAQIFLRLFQECWSLANDLAKSVKDAKQSHRGTDRGSRR
ncbi:MAG TPA: DUF4062 domain-containing protein [Pirellulales bacterium]|nr:DUF4062 domain-containing protein [Pirellulales bacterium]